MGALDLYVDPDRDPVSILIQSSPPAKVA